MALGSHDHHDVFQGLSGQHRHSGISLRIAHREQQEQLLIRWAPQQRPEVRAAVEGSGGHGVEACVLQQDPQEGSETDSCAGQLHPLLL